MRAGQRIIAELAEIGLAGGTMLELREDSAARSHLTRSLTLTEVSRDQFAFYHDVLRDWGIGNLIHEDYARLSRIDLTVPASPRVARGIEFSARLALEASRDCTRWLSLLGRLSPPRRIALGEGTDCWRSFARKSAQTFLNAVARHCSLVAARCSLSSSRRSPQSTRYR